METEEKKEQEEVKSEEKATEKEAAPTLEALQAQIAELTRHAKNKEEEAARHAKKVEAFEKAEKEREEAKLSEIEKANKKLVEVQAERDAAQKELADEKVRISIFTEASKPQFGEKKSKFIEPEVAYKLLTDEEKSGDVLEALKGLAKKYPYLLEQTAQAGDGVGSPKRGKQSNPSMLDKFKMPVRP